ALPARGAAGAGAPDLSTPGAGGRPEMGTAPGEKRLLVGRLQMPRIFLASPSDFIDSSCLPALCWASPSARSCLTLAALSALNIGLVASLASMAFISLGQLWAIAVPA